MWSSAECDPAARRSSTTTTTTVWTKVRSAKKKKKKEKAEPTRVPVFPEDPHGRLPRGSISSTTEEPPRRLSVGHARQMQRESSEPGSLSKCWGWDKLLQLAGMHPRQIVKQLRFPPNRERLSRCLGDHPPSRWPREDVASAVRLLRVVLCSEEVRCSAEEAGLIAGALAGLGVDDLPEDCRDPAFFDDLAASFERIAAAEGRGGSAAAATPLDAKVVLAALGAAVACLDPADGRTQGVIRRLQDLDNRRSPASGASGSASGRGGSRPDDRGRTWEGAVVAEARDDVTKRPGDGGRVVPSRLPVTARRVPVRYGVPVQPGFFARKVFVQPGIVSRNGGPTPPGNVPGYRLTHPGNVAWYGVPMQPGNMSRIGTAQPGNLTKIRTVQHGKHPWFGFTTQSGNDSTQSSTQSGKVANGVSTQPGHVANLCAVRSDNARLMVQRRQTNMLNDASLTREGLWQTVGRKGKSPRGSRATTTNDWNNNSSHALGGQLFPGPIDKKAPPKNADGKKTFFPFKHATGKVRQTAKDCEALVKDVLDACASSAVPLESVLPEVVRKLAALCPATPPGAAAATKNKNLVLRDLLLRSCSGRLLDAVCADLEHGDSQRHTQDYLEGLGKVCLKFCEVAPERAGLFEAVVKLTRRAIDFQNFPFFPKVVEAGLRQLHCTLTQVEYVSGDAPPDDFRKISVVPTAEDFACVTVFLRENRIDGPYGDEDEYRDTHFRLLREDFVKPLRDAVAEIRGRPHALQRGDEHRWGSVKIYKDVQFAKSKDMRNPGSLVMVFDRSHSLNNIDWAMSKRFMTGSLLAVSDDNFATVHLAKVARRDLGMLTSGRLAVEVFGSAAAKKQLLQLGRSFTVAESTVFFEPYFHVLRALQAKRAEDGDAFPLLTKYIVRAESDDQRPDYLDADLPEDVEGTRSSSGRRVYKVPLAGLGRLAELDVVSGTWPTPAEMGLNPSQHEALRGALTRKVMLVQGPPGTGKTFLGLRVVKTLLMNPHAWRHTGGAGDGMLSPIVVVCYTNHALDQFLAGLLDATDSLVRLGGRCKDPRLEDYALNVQPELLSVELRRAFARQRKLQGKAQEELEALQDAMTALAEPRGVVSLDTLVRHGVVDEGRAAALTMTRSSSGIMSWLEAGRRRGSAVGDADVTDSRGNPTADRSNRFVAFDETFSGMCGRLEELQDLVSSGFAQHAGPCQAARARYHYFYDRAPRGTARGLAAVATEDVLAALDADNLGDLDERLRWEVYRFWVFRLRAALVEKEQELERTLADCIEEVRKVRMLQDREFIASKLVVGMTTTKAAQLQPLLQALKPRIVVVEEAAEVLESHVIAALTPSVQHLLLLGDHKQLRPSPSTYEMEVKYHLDVSLFERLCNNGLPCQALNIQHRMRPEIAALIRSIYPGLRNHESVAEYPPVRGLANNVFFVDHRMREQPMEEMLSHSNPHEARFLGALVRYLLQQGYSDDRITVLTAYSGQLIYMKRLAQDVPALGRVRICNVDNFQGEECDVILLSLVRSNPKNIIGFLKTENRVCVALSRAKHGMIMVGDLKALAAGGEIWRVVRGHLTEQLAVGPRLTLRCTEHPDQTLDVSTDSDFQAWREGGCTRRCDYIRQRCGHRCASQCHRWGVGLPHPEGDPCLAVCNRPICAAGHLCENLCYQPCQTYCERRKTVELKCGHTGTMACSKNPDTYKCNKKDKRVLKRCGHENVITCYMDGPCKVPCKGPLRCGHECKRTCHKFVDPDHLQYKCAEPCTRPSPACSSASSPHMCVGLCGEPCPPCAVHVRRPLPGCGHVATVVCSSGVGPCTAPCPRRLAGCDHPCRRECGQECGGCQVLVKKEHPGCGHSLTMPCSADPARETCTEQCDETLPCGHKCPKPCRLQCRPCTQMVSKELPRCKHEVMVPCEADAADATCDKKCPDKLACGHPCPARCGEPCDDKKCLRKVVLPQPALCGHHVKVPCREAASLAALTPEDLQSRCRRPCTVRLPCGHRCKGNCFECRQGRLHRVCDEPCERVLVCGHGCPDECGRPCLPCRQPCPVTCAHNTKCQEPCGRVCTPCQKKCESGRPFFKCLRKCRESCSWSPSDAPCVFPVKKCRHDSCVGLHGDPCPPLCLQCDAAEFGDPPPSPGDRFVFLPDCGHTVPLKALDSLVRDRSTEVSVLCCPRAECRKPATNCVRYANDTKERLKSVAAVFKEMGPSPHWREKLTDHLMNLKGILQGQTAHERRMLRQNAPVRTDTRRPTYRLMGLVAEAAEQELQASRLPASSRTAAQAASAARAVRSLCAHADLLAALDDGLRASLRLRAPARRAEVGGRVDALAEALLARDCRLIGEPEVRYVNAEVVRIQRVHQICMIEEAVDDDEDRRDLLHHGNDDHRRVSDLLRSSAPYPLANVDETVKTAIARLADAFGVKVQGIQWARPLDLPLSAAVGTWLTCKMKHVFSKTGAGRRCPKCPQAQ